MRPSIRRRPTDIAVGDVAITGHRVRRVLEVERSFALCELEPGGLYLGVFPFDVIRTKETP